MPKVTYVEPDGSRHEVQAVEGWTIMEAALRNGVPRIEGECGGACACATCHVSVDPDWYGKVGQPDEVEESMLDFAPVRTPTSRLSCQIAMTEELDGLVVNLPESQR